jgi:hypothetical protein
MEHTDLKDVAKILHYQDINCLRVMLIDIYTLIRKLHAHGSFPFTPTPLLKRLEKVTKVLEESRIETRVH